MGDQVLAIAHRGASADRPENTCGAFEEALRQGADGIELDVQLSRDEIAVVHHDDRWHGAGGDGPLLSDLDAEAIRRLGGTLDTPGGGGHIPTLQDVLADFGRRTLLMVEIKALDGTARNARLARAVVDLVRQTSTEQNVILLSFDPVVLDVCHDLAPSIRRAWNLDRGPMLRRRLRRRLPSLHAVGADVRHLSAPITAEVHRAGRKLFVYTCNAEPEVEAAVAAGASFVLSDRPAWLKAQLAGRVVRHGT
jgi:glycerophosphoryl diester phosphodiesterase